MRKLSVLQKNYLSYWESKFNLSPLDNGRLILYMQRISIQQWFVQFMWVFENSVKP